MLKHTRLALCLWHSRWCPLLLVSKAAEFQPRKNTPAPAGLAWTPGTLAGESHCAGWRVLELRVGFLETSLLPPTSSQIFPLYLFFLINFYWSIVVLGLPWWLSGKESTCQFRRHGFDPYLGRSPAEGQGNPLWYCCLGNPMDRGAWQAAVHGIVMSWT